jgi:hypothetical protein
MSGAAWVSDNVLVSEKGTAAAIFPEAVPSAAFALLVFF